MSSAALKWLPRIRLQRLNQQKIRALAQHWLGSERTDTFFSRLGESLSLSELMEIPLFATLILAVFRKTACVPPNKTTLYALFVELLCGGWDFYKDVQRRLNKFTTKDKEIALTRLAGMLQNRGDRDASEADFRNALKASLAGLSGFWDDLLEEIVEDGLLVRVGNELTFSHQSFQEFLAARDLRDHMGNRPKQALGWYLSGNEWWKEVLAFYVTLSDRPADTDEWVVDRALKLTNRVPDLTDRVAFLRAALRAAHPGFKETPASEKYFANLPKPTTRVI